MHVHLVVVYYLQTGVLGVKCSASEVVDRRSLTHCRGFFFPGTGGPHEVGKGPGEGYSVNVPWPRGGMGNGDYLCVFQHLVLPIAYEFAPDIIIVSAGFDAAEGDPLGGYAPA